MNVSQWNEPCPCGSGKSYKECCAAPAALSVDFVEKQITFFTNNILINELKRENEAKAKIFDEQYQEDLQEISAEYARAASILWAGISNLSRNNSTHTGQSAAASLLQHVLKTIEASIDLTRRGYRHQVGILARNIIEIIATILCIAIDPTTLEKVRKGKFESSKAISTVKKIIPIFGQLYGHLSSNFTHLTIKDFMWEPLLSQKNSETTDACIAFAKMSIVLTSLATELIFHDQVEQPRFWVEVAPDAYTCKPSADTEKWLKAFLTIKRQSE